MSDMIPRKTSLSLFLILIKPFIEFFYLWGNSEYVLPDNGLKIEISTYLTSTDSITQPDSSLIQLKSLSKSLLLDLLASNWAKASFKLIISIL